MSKQHVIEDFVQNSQTKITTIIKNRMFDFIAAGILIAMLALNLGVLELRDITLQNLLNILIECVPFFLTAVLLAINYYTKGTFAGKSTHSYETAISAYSKSVNSLTGEQIEQLPEFCKYYNTIALKQLQENILKRASIKYEDFNEEKITESGDIILPLKVLSKKELLEKYSKERVKLILKAKRVKVKGLTTNVLLGSTSSADITDLGYTEIEMSKSRTKSSALMYAISTLFMTLIGIKDILQWGWAGLLIVAFKLIYILCSSFMNHFKGYNDITISLVNHIARKTDILKQFDWWYTNKNNTK